MKLWSTSGFHSVPARSALIVDSYLLREGKVVGLRAHEHRFARSVWQPVPAEFFAAVRAELPRTGTWFPRLEWWGEADFALSIRTAPSLRTTTSLWHLDSPDPRLDPTHKGPDLELLQQLRIQAQHHNCDDALLSAEDGAILEAANAAVVFWKNPSTVVLPARPVLDSITVGSTIPLWEAQGIKVVQEDITDLTLPAWYGNSVQGWTAVTRWRRHAQEMTAAPAPAVKHWNQALWSTAEKL